MYKNAEGYPDPTAGAALEHIEHEEYLKKGNSKSPWYEIARKGTIHHLSHEENSSIEHDNYQIEH